ncbi:hypothetical protein CEXT_779161 [Caerostris extrusa]|uniref:DNA topoisomerase I DNA binding eukaryotic-type domain-containing protein n=1 Tax=Caerostris extrusa TaxID=172846 RepID=A0AAV4XUW3_CAEEX|nr:hypothetical protein CEXT_779161 [Caerostris extrusa]
METDDLIERNGPLQAPSNSHVMLSNLTDEERCVRISDVLKKRDVAQHLYEAYAAALTSHSLDDDDLKRITILHDEFQNAMEEISKMKRVSLPRPPRGHRWKEVCHDNKVAWLAKWAILGSTKYMMLGAGSKLKAEKIS